MIVLSECQFLESLIENLVRNLILRDYVGKYRKFGRNLKLFYRWRHHPKTKIGITFDLEQLLTTVFLQTSWFFMFLVAVWTNYSTKCRLEFPSKFRFLRNETSHHEKHHEAQQHFAILIKKICLSFFHFTSVSLHMIDESSGWTEEWDENPHGGVFKQDENSSFCVSPSQIRE